MTNLNKKQWVQKYEPNTLDDYIYQNDEQHSRITSIIDDGLVGHVLLSGVQGTGKTTLSKLIVNTLGIDSEDVLTINASDENSVDVIRNKVSEFVSLIPNGDIRIVQLEECDFISKSGQAALRHMMEECVDTAKFILTCNYPHKIMPALKSRVHYQIDFKAPDKRAIMKRIIEILLSESVKFEPADIGKYVDVYYPDMRKIIQHVQESTHDGKLLPPSAASGNDDYKFKLLEYLEVDSWPEIRTLVCEQVSDDEIEDVFRFLYDNLKSSNKFKDRSKWEAGQVKIAEYLYKDSLVSDREINISALFIELGMI